MFLRVEFVPLGSCPPPSNNELKDRDTVAKQSEILFESIPKEELARVKVHKGPELLREGLFITTWLGVTSLD